MKIIAKIDNEFVINHHFVLEHENIKYIRIFDTKTKDVRWDYGLNPDIKYPDNMDIKLLEFLFNKSYRKDKLERIIKKH